MMGSLNPDVRNQLKEVENNLGKMENFIETLDLIDYDTVTSSMTPEARAKYDITITYAINSLFWMYMRSLGEDPNSHKIKEELDRIKDQSRKLQQINDKAKRPKVDTGAASRMIQRGIKHKGRKPTEENWDDDNDGVDKKKSKSTRS